MARRRRRRKKLRKLREKYAKAPDRAARETVAEKIRKISPFAELEAEDEE